MKQNRILKFILTCTAVVSLISGYTQSAVFFNPSFEGDAQDAVTPVGWLQCEDGTTPDILPGPWGVYLKPADGNTFMGLITRKDGSWESVGQRLSQTLGAGNCYFFKLMLARAITYNGFNKPTVLRVWGGSDRCEKRQKLFESGPIVHTDWKPYTIRFKPKKDIDFIIIEAFYNKKLSYTYNGNLLIDDLTPIFTCDKAELIVRK
ncbi:MAG: hypothetical protein ABI844_01330 [Saprospiraceae bacterium]